MTLLADVTPKAVIHIPDGVCFSLDGLHTDATSQKIARQNMVVRICV